MKKLLLLTKTLLAAALLCVGQNAWGTPTIIKTYDFDAATDAVADQTVLGYSGTTTFGKTGCDNLTGDWAGIAVQGAASWHIYHKDSKGNLAGKGYYNNNGGGRLLAVLDLKAGDIVHITANAGLPTSATNGTYDSGKSTEGSDCYYTVMEDGNFAVSFTRYNYIHVVTVTRDLADLEAPTYEITGANGTERQVTLSCLTDGAEIKYNTTDDKSAAGWTTYSAPFYTSETTLYAYSEKSATTSDVIEITTGAGTTLKLNTPVLTKTAYADGNYTISISSDQSSLAVVPASPSVKYSIDGGDAQTYSAPLSVAGGKTITSWVENTGYTTSDNANITTAARPTYYATEWTQDYRNVTSAAGTGVQTISLSDESFTINEVVFKNIVSYGDPAVEVNLNTNVGLNTTSGVGLRCNGANSGIIVNGTDNAKIGIKNLKVGDYIVLYVTGIVPTASYGCTLQEGMSTWSEYYFRATETSASINIPKGTFNYIYTITVLSSSVSATIGSTGWTTFASPYALDLSSLDGATAYYASATSAESVTVLPTSSSAVQAGEGILLKGTAGATITIPVVASGSAIAGNLMVGCPIATAITSETANYDKCYVLGIESEQAVFQNVKNHIDGSNTVNIPAGKAYLNATASNGARSMSIVFADDVTGVANVEAASEAKAKEGKFIENGKLVIVKNGVKYNAAGAKLY